MEMLTEIKAERKADREVGARLQAMHNKIKIKEDKLRAAWVKFDAEPQVFKADRMKAYEKRMAKWKADQETREAERKVNTEKIEPIERMIGILEQMIEQEMKAKADAD
jgi:hypothetical protein